MEKVPITARPGELIRRTIEYLQQRIRIQQVVLYGAHARGEASEGSDVNLAVISPDFSRMTQPEVMDMVVDVVLEVDPAVEVRPYTPGDLKEARFSKNLGHILAEGRRVYEEGKYLL